MRELASVATGWSECAIALDWTYRTSVGHRPHSDQLEKVSDLEQTIKGGHAEVTAEVCKRLPMMSLADRRDFLCGYYRNRRGWADYRSRYPTQAEMKAWADREFPDRRALGLVPGDLRHLDIDAYQKITNWGRETSVGNPSDIADDLGFPMKKKLNDALIRTSTLPTGADVFRSLRRGDPDALQKSRIYAMAKNRRLRSLRKMH